MPFFDAIRIGASGAAADTAYTVDRSLRFNSADTHYLTRTPSSTGNQKVWTWSAWVKRTILGTQGYLFVSNEANSSGDGIAGLYFQNDQLYTYYDTSSSSTYGAVNSRKYRDASAWYHIVWQVDAANTTHRIWINGVEETSLSNNPINYNYTMNQSGHANVIGTSPWNTSSAPANMYLAEVHFSDGNKYEASDFGETDATTGQWVPKSVSITYGTNGYYLNFSDNSGTSATTMGKDTSGNGNNFTPVNFATHDAVKDSPTNNFCTFNPLSNYDNCTLSEGNLKVTGTGSDHNWQQVRGNMGVSSGKWYFEIRCNSIAANEGWIAGIHEVFGRDTEGYYWYSNGYTAAGYGYAYGVQDNNQKRGNTSSNDGSFSSDVTAGKVVGVRMNLDDNEILISVDGVDKGKMYDIQSGITYTPAVNIYSTSSATLNCGQDSTFQGQESSGGNTDGGGIGDFAYAVPSGYLALCSANLPDPTILLPNKHFAAFTYTGTGSSGDVVNITNSDVDFTPDWVWVKTRSVSNDHILSDSVRGGTKYLVSSENYAEATDTDKIRAFIQNGFESGTDGDTNWPSRPFVAWNWNGGETDGKTYAVTVVSDSGNKYRFDGYGTSAVTLDLAEGGTYVFDWSDSSAQSHPVRFSTTSDGTHGGGSEYTTGVVKDDSAYKTTITVAASAPTLYYYCQNHSGMGGQVNTNSTLGSSNFDGTIQSVAKANATAGFSISTYTGNGSSGSTIGHGLGVKPDAIIIKCRSVADNWIVYHQGLNGGVDPEDYYLFLNTNNAEVDSPIMLNDTAPTSSVITFQNDSTNNLSGRTYVMYCFSEVAGYSKFGSYIGNGDSNGPFVFTGFRPAWVMIKRSSAYEGWHMFDNKRDPDNVIEDRLEADSSAASFTGYDWIDFLSNGFKTRINIDNTNGSGHTYVYLAFAEAPFKNARAR